MAHATHALTPSDLEITPRDRRFGRGPARRHWHGGSVEATAIFNALSATFPKGEAFFVESVRAFRSGVPPRLAAEIKAFTTQEAVHSREHLAFNRVASDAGYDLSALERKVDDRLALLRGKPKIASLAATMALEHFTAMFAHELLADPRHLEGADKEIAELWRWHAVEEIEHKGVAYDTWLQATADWPRLKRWSVKAQIMLILTHHFVKDRTAGALELMRQDGIAGLRAWGKLLHYLWVRPGMFRKVFGAWASYFMPRFHPWKLDDRDLLLAYEAGVAQMRAPASQRKVRGTV
ncbi:MAG: metal-dependent hydrolase [Sphingomicrobium sp.]